MKVMVTEGDLRFMLSYGDDAENEVAAGQTLPRFNTIGNTLEWRLEKGDDGIARPTATILRFFTDPDVEGGRKGQVLVITKLGGPGQICQMGRVNALANPDANAMPRPRGRRQWRGGFRLQARQRAALRVGAEVRNGLNAREASDQALSPRPQAKAILVSSTSPKRSLARATFRPPAFL